MKKEDNADNIWLKGRIPITDRTISFHSKKPSRKGIVLFDSELLLRAS